MNFISILLVLVFSSFKAIVIHHLKNKQNKTKQGSWPSCKMNKYKLRLIKTFESTTQLKKLKTHMNFYWRFFFKIISKSWYIYHVWAVKNSIWEGIVHPQWNDLCLVIKWETKKSRNQYIFSGNHEAENEHMHDYAGLESPLFRAQPMMSFYVHLNVVAALLLLSKTSPASQVTKKTWSRISDMTEEKQASYFLCLEFSSCRKLCFMFNITTMQGGSQGPQRQ